MKNELYHYMAVPSIYRVGVPTEITVLAVDARYTFTDDGIYTVAMMPLRENQIRFDMGAVTVKAAVREGKLVFTYTFPREQEYFLRVFLNGDRLFQISVYALEDDLYERRPLKGDTHVHSCRSDGQDTPAVVAANYRAAGFDFMALTDHHRYEPSVEAIEAYRDVKLGMTQLRGEEVHSPETYLHIVNFGGSFSVNKLFQDDKDMFYREVGYINRTEPIPFTDERSRFVYASALWCARMIRRGGGIAIFPHPYWISNMFNVPDDMTRALLMNDVFDAFELIGGQSAHENNFQTQRYYELREEYLEKRGKRLSIPLLGASDSHGTINRPWFNRKYSVVFAKSRSEADIVSAIREGQCCAVEVYEDSSNYTVHGTYRLSSYARFLCENYFPRTEKFCATEGELMREYTLGYDVRELLAKRCHVGDSFYRMVFGK
ncbi:MAG: hypothetical protein IJ493_03590 [Clostridia bacterium]|nr:hypothetical protein [Clostridia bacterium]